MEAWGLTHRGAVRQQNQDAFAIRNLPDGRVIALVCDGMGGARAGNIASAMAVKLFTEEFLRTSGREEERMRKAAALANRDVFQRSLRDEDCAGMGTTLVAALAGEGGAVILNEGDSRAYHISPDGITRITRDHSLVENMVERGDITEEEARRHPNKNLITRALGPDENADCDGFICPLEKGDFVLLCSDGLVDTVTDQEMLYEVIHGGELDTCLDRLMEIAKSRGAADNVTVVLMQNN